MRNESLCFVLLAVLCGSISTCTAFAAKPMDGIAVIGCGVLGTSLCKQLLASPGFASRTVTGVTKTESRHESIQATVDCQDGRFEVVTSDNLNGRTFRDVVFCAPPSGFTDYPAAVRDASLSVWAGKEHGGSFVFTSSGGIYGGQDGETVNESSPTSDPDSSPRVARLIHAEEATLANGGACLRLAGLYTKERGAHSFWLNSGKDVSGREDGIINLVHYDDAASACLAALQVGPDVVSGKVFLISDGNPTTRRGIVEAALTNDLYKDKTMPAFLGGESDPKGKVYDGSYSNKALKWTPTHESFSSFMKSA